MLTEGDDQQDPIADAARAILDGHIVLSRTLAEAGQYPAIDVEASISRVMNDIVEPEHVALVQRFRQMNSIYRQNEDLITVGAYTPGSDTRIDEAIIFHPQLLKFLQQSYRQPMNWQTSMQDLVDLFREHQERQQAYEQNSKQMTQSKQTNRGQA